MRGTFPMRITVGRQPSQNRADFVATSGTRFEPGPKTVSFSSIPKIRDLVRTRSQISGLERVFAQPCDALDVGPGPRLVGRRRGPARLGPGSNQVPDLGAESESAFRIRRA